MLARFYGQEPVVLLLVTYALFLILEDGTKMVQGVDQYIVSEPYGFLGNVNIGNLSLQLSAGQQKLVAVGPALVTGSRLLMLDEPFEGVAPALSKRIAEVIGELRSAGLAVILSGADLQHAGSVLDAVYRIDRGQMLA